MAYLITKQMIQDGIKAACETNSLTIQNGDYEGCHYIESHSGCAIGAWLPLWVLNQIWNAGANGLSVNKLEELGILRFESDETAKLAYDLQYIYDRSNTIYEFVNKAERLGIYLN